MTTAQPPEPEARPSLGSLGRWATDTRTLLAALGILLYAVLRVAYSVFYNRFGLSPDDLGLNYVDLIVQSAVGTVILLAATLALVALTVALYVGLIESLLANLLSSSLPFIPEKWKRRDPDGTPSTGDPAGAALRADS